MIKTCGDCEYYFRGICNAGRCPTSSVEETDCSDFQLVDINRRDEEQQKLQSKVRIEEKSISNEYRLISFNDSLFEQMIFIHNRFGVRPTAFLVHPYTFRDEIHNRFRDSYELSMLCSYSSLSNNGETNNRFFYDRFFYGLKPIQTQDIEQNTVLVLVPNEVIYGRNSRLIRPFGI